MGMIAARPHGLAAIVSPVVNVAAELRDSLGTGTRGQAFGVRMHCIELASGIMHGLRWRMSMVNLKMKRAWQLRVVA